MENAVRIYQVRQALSDKQLGLLSTMSRSDLCFFRFTGGNTSETEQLAEQLFRLKATGVLLIGIFRFPFRFEGKKRLQTAIVQYHQMKDLCDAMTYFHSDGMLEVMEPGTSVETANQTIDALEEAPVRAFEEMIRVPGQMNIDVRDIQTFMRGTKGPVYVRTFEGDTFDEPLKYVLGTPYLPPDYAEGTQMIINIGYTKSVDMTMFQQMNLRLNDLFDKADLFKLGTHLMEGLGRRFQITLVVKGLTDPFPRPVKMQRFQHQRLWMKRQWANMAKKREGRSWFPLIHNNQVGPGERQRAGE